MPAFKSSGISCSCSDGSSGLLPSLQSSHVLAAPLSPLHALSLTTAIGPRDLQTLILQDTKARFLTPAILFFFFTTTTLGNPFEKGARSRMAPTNTRKQRKPVKVLSSQKLTAADESK